MIRTHFLLFLESGRMILMCLMGMRSHRAVHPSQHLTLQLSFSSSSSGISAHFITLFWEGALGKADLVAFLKKLAGAFLKVPSVEPLLI